MHTTRARSFVPALLCSALGSCAGFGPVPPELAAALASRAESAPACERRTAIVEVESTQLSGTFVGLLVVRGGEEPAVRMQLLPDLGGKVLDLAVSRTRIAGYFPHADAGLELAAAGIESPPRHPLWFIAASLLESALPMTPERVRGARRTTAPEGENDGALELELDPPFAAVQLRAIVAPSGELLERRWSSRGAHWSERLGPVHEFVAPGFSLRIRDERREPMAELPDALFALELPPTVRR